MKSPAPSSSLPDDAYLFQYGQFYPERHEANLRRLRKKYPAHSAAEIDAIYREARAIDSALQEEIGAAHLSPGARALLLEWLEERFPRFSRSVLADAIVRAGPL